MLGSKERFSCICKWTCKHKSKGDVIPDSVEEVVVVVLVVAVLEAVESVALVVDVLVVPAALLVLLAVFSAAGGIPILKSQHSIIKAKVM